MSARRRATNGRAVDNRDTVIEHTNTQEDDRSGGNRDIDIENTFYAAPPDRHAHGSRRRARRVCACVGGEVCGRGSDEPPQRWFVARTYIPAPHYGCVGKYTSHGQRAQSRVATHEATRECAGSNHTLPSGLVMGQSHNAHLDTKPKPPQYSHCPLVEAQHPRIVCETSNATKTRHTAVDIVRKSADTEPNSRRVSLSDPILKITVSTEGVCGLSHIYRRSTRVRYMNTIKRY